MLCAAEIAQVANEEQSQVLCPLSAAHVIANLTQLPNFSLRLTILNINKYCYCQYSTLWKFWNILAALILLFCQVFQCIDCYRGVKKSPRNITITNRQSVFAQLVHIHC